MPPAIRVSHLSKSYRVSHAGARSDTFTDLFTNLIRRPFRARPPTPPDETFWALRDVTFDVQPGEVVGIIGRNGAGKSTLLKILSRVTAPTEGRVELRGRVASLLEVGTGFHPELTGRENVYMNGSILGMKRAEIDRKFDAMVDFAGVERFLDTPLKRYSSGMYVRLAFAVAAHLDPEILIIDEVLAVGDAEFQRKCLGTMKDAASYGRTVLFVSHNLAAVSRLCTRGILLNAGQFAADGPTRTVLDDYERLMQGVRSASLSDRKDRSGSGEVRLERLDVLGSAGNPVEVVRSGDQVRLCLHYATPEGKGLSRASFAISFYHDGAHMMTLCNDYSEAEWPSLSPQGCITCWLDKLPLSPGNYEYNLYCAVAGATADWIISAGMLTVEAGDYYGSGRLPGQSHPGVLVPQRWTSS